MTIAVKDRELNAIIERQLIQDELLSSRDLSDSNEKSSPNQSYFLKSVYKSEWLEAPKKSERKSPPKKVLVAILSLDEDATVLKSGSGYQSQAALHVLGYGGILGKSGQWGCGIDGIVGKKTKKAKRQFMEDYNIKDPREAEAKMVQLARRKLINEAREKGWNKVEDRLERARLSEKDISLGKSIYNESWQEMEEANVESEEELKEAKEHFDQVEGRMNNIGKKSAQPKEEGRLLRRAKKDLILSDHPYPVQSRIEIYEEYFELLGESLDVPEGEYMSVKRSYAQKARELGVEDKVIAQTLRYFNSKRVA